MKHFTKFSRAIIAIVMMLGVSLSTLAHDFEVDGIYYNILNKTAKTVGVTFSGSSFSEVTGEYTGEVVIPNSVTYSGTTYSVTSIGVFAFDGCTGLTSVTIPNSVTSIGAQAFYGCTGLTSVIIPNSVTSIGDNAFYGCSGLTEVTIPNSVTSIGNGAFSGCTGLTDVTIPNSVTSIDSYAFNGCDGLTTVNFNATNCTSMGSYSYPVFSGCSNLSTLNIGENVTNIPVYAFRGCSGLTSVTIPNSVTSIGDSAFYKCSGLTSVSIGNSVTSIGNYAFYKCSGLTSVTIPNSVTYIGSHAFEICNGLTSVTIGNSVTSIDSYAFKGCSKLTSVTIPNSVTSIGDRAFYGCSGLISVTIPNSVTSIGSSAFSGCTGLTSVTIPNSVTSIGSAFKGCSGLTSVTIPNSVTSIGDWAFEYCSGLTSVTIPSSVTSIGEWAFEYCSGLKKIISLNPTPPTCASEESFYSNNYTEATLYVPKDSYAKYFIDGVWGKFTKIVKVETLVSSIKLNATSIQLDKGSDYTLSATINPTDATITDIIWTSSNPQVATVDRSGKVRALSAGTTTISATTIDGSEVSASCNVTVNNVETKIALSKTEASLPVNEIMTLNYTIVPSTTSVQWSTSDPNIAAIKVNSDNSVTVVGMADGIATITATATDGSDVSASCVVTVGNAGITDVKSDNAATEVARYDINGRKLSQPSKGINIIKMSDGSTRKEWVKE